ncbi:MAG: IS200/IS605 family transposase [Phycisphaerae bacterium]|nr:IS200/IS605 family transposase [Phycisphaerae bacterium]
MPQSLAMVPLHLVFSTKHREPLITDAVRARLHRYMAVVARNMDCPAIIVNSVEDHAHVLVEFGRTVTIAQLVEEMKTSSSKWIKTQGVTPFAWQAGYGAFAVSASNVPRVRRYIENQREHHRRRGFQEEMRKLYTSSGVKFDERYVWD